MMTQIMPMSTYKRAFDIWAATKAITENKYSAEHAAALLQWQPEKLPEYPYLFPILEELGGFTSDFTAELGMRRPDSQGRAGQFSGTLTIAVSHAWWFTEKDSLTQHLEAWVKIDFNDAAYFGRDLSYHAFRIPISHPDAVYLAARKLMTRKL